ncbi:3355_t:CDS:2, partial [Racocetra fulgida]
RFANLEQKQSNVVDGLEDGNNSSENDVNIPDLVIKSLEDDTPASDITDDTSNFDIYVLTKQILQDLEIMTRNYESINGMYLK